MAHGFAPVGLFIFMDCLREDCYVEIKWQGSHKVAWCHTCEKQIYYGSKDCCENPDIHFVRVEGEFKSYHQRICLSCRYVFGVFIPKGKLKGKVYQITDKKKQECNEFREQNLRILRKWICAFNEEINERNRQKRQQEYEKYIQYLGSEKWRQKRLAVLKRDNYKCQSCGQIGHDVHHISYDNLYDEPLSDLIVLCRSCHKTLHHDS